MKFLKENGFPLALVAGGFAVWAVLYPRMPAVVPQHWNCKGVADGHGPRLSASVLLPAQPHLLVRQRPRSPDPEEEVPGDLPEVVAEHGKEHAHADEQRPLDAERRARLNEVHHHPGIDEERGEHRHADPVCTGESIHPESPRGDRRQEPQQEVRAQRERHRLAGKLFVGAGAAVVIGGVAGLPMAPVVVPVLLLAGLTPALYSYVLYRRMEGFKG